MNRTTMTWLMMPLLVVMVAAPVLGQASGTIKCLLITGDHGHNWKATTPVLKEFLTKGGRIQVDVTTTPAKDLTAGNLARYDVLLLNYQDRGRGGPDAVWSDDNMEAFLAAVRGGKGLVVYHYASAAFKQNKEFERAIAGGWRSQGFHGPRHEFKVRKAMNHPIMRRMPREFAHPSDELYSNSLMFEDCQILATAWCDPDKPKGTGKHEPVIWVSKYGEGRVYNNALGHDVPAMDDENFRELMRRGVEWTATGKVARNR